MGYEFQIGHCFFRDLADSHALQRISTRSELGKGPALHALSFLQ